MILKILLICLIAPLYAQLNNTKTFDTDRIIGGTVTTISQHKYHVALLTPVQFYCGGSLIRWQWVLTAGHCTHGLKATDFRVRAGSTYWNKYGVLARVSAIFNNPKFVYSTLTHDCALLKLKSDIRSFASKYPLRTIGLSSTLPIHLDSVQLAGWGLIKQPDTYPYKLRSVSMKYISKAWCQNSYGNLDGTMICAGLWRGGVGACYGDSGGGLKFNGKLVGVVSFGNICAQAKFPTVFLNVRVVKAWILKVIKNNS